jgi:N-acetyl sugar amidotransferase
MKEVKMMTEELLKYCTNCVMPNTRPRITFNENGVCNACQWAEEKKQINWDERWTKLVEICEKEKEKNKEGFNCIIPVSGGKDSCYVSYKMKHELGMNPLCISIKPPLPKAVGEENLIQFAEAGYNLMAITPDPQLTSQISKYGFVNWGQPLYSWMLNVRTIIFRLAIQMKISLIIFGDEGELEYGGSTQLKDKFTNDMEFTKKIRLSDNNPEVLKEHFPNKNLFWWNFPSEEDFNKNDIKVTHFSFFENWDPYRNYLVSKKYFKFKEQKEQSIGTYHNFTQTDCTLYDLHTYLMYLKFGFGRCSQDVGIDVRRGALTRDQGIKLVQVYDGQSIEKYKPQYLEYFQMTSEEFDDAIEKSVNKKLFKKEEGKWVPLFQVR